MGLFVGPGVAEAHVETLIPLFHIGRTIAIATSMPRVQAKDLQICPRARARVNVATPSRAATSQLRTIEGTTVRVVGTAATLLPDVVIL